MYYIYELTSICFIVKLILYYAYCYKDKFRLSITN
jgi:hypothetical protein